MSIPEPEIPDREARTLSAVSPSDALEQRIAELEDALAERIELVDRLYTERRHLELDLAVKDDYISALRADLLQLIPEHQALKLEHEELVRSRHYRVAVLMHRLLKALPFVHRFVRDTSSRVTTGAPPAT